MDAPRYAHPAEAGAARKYHGRFGILLPLTSRGGLSQLQQNLAVFVKSLLRTVPDHATRVRILIGVDVDDTPMQQLLSNIFPTAGNRTEALDAGEQHCAHVLARLCGYVACCTHVVPGLHVPLQLYAMHAPLCVRRPRSGYTCNIQRRSCNSKQAQPSFRGFELRPGCVQSCTRRALPCRC